MPLFMCPDCKCVENTALSEFWYQRDFEKVDPQCSECRTGKWHGAFEKRPASGYHIDQKGFLWSGKEASALPPHVRLVGVIP